MALLPTHHGINPHHPESNPRPLHSQRSALTPLLLTKCQATSPLSSHAHETFKNVNIPYQKSLTPLNRGQKSKF
jgi:hypothetical protein